MFNFINFNLGYDRINNINTNFCSFFEDSIVLFFFFFFLLFFFIVNIII